MDGIMTYHTQNIICTYVFYPHPRALSHSVQTDSLEPKIIDRNSALFTTS